MSDTADQYNMSAVEEYRKALRIADEILSEQYATTLHVSSTSRELADAAIAALVSELNKQEWILDTFMHNRHRYMEIRAGYKDIFDLVKQDLADDYEHRGEEE